MKKIFTVFALMILAVIPVHADDRIFNVPPEYQGSFWIVATSSDKGRTWEESKDNATTPAMIIKARKMIRENGKKADIFKVIETVTNDDGSIHMIILVTESVATFVTKIENENNLFLMKLHYVDNPKQEVFRMKMQKR